MKDMSEGTRNQPERDGGVDEETVRRIVDEVIEEKQTGGTRRDVLKGAGLLGAAGLAGAGSAAASTSNSASGTLSIGSVTSNTYRIAGDLYGGPASARSELESELGSGDAGSKYRASDTGGWYHWTGSAWSLMDGDFTSVTTDDINNGRSGRWGDTVYYDPRDSGPYVDGQDALADTPPGSTLLLAATDYDVATEGRLAMSKARRIQGSGWAVTSDGVEGTNINNTGGDTVNSPPIEFSDTAERHGAYVDDCHIQHEGASPAILVDNHIRSVVTRNRIDMFNSGQAGIEWDRNAYFALAYRNHVSRFTGNGFEVAPTATGSQYRILACHSGSQQTGSKGVYSSKNGTWVIGGQHDGASHGVHFDNQTGGVIAGGGVRDVLCETSTTALEVGGANTWRHVDLVRPRIKLSSVTTGVRFGNADGATARYPQIESPASGNTQIEWTTDSSRCGAVATWRALANGTVTDNGSENYVLVPEVLPDTRISNLPTGAPVVVACRRTGTAGGTDWSPAFYDTAAGAWYEQSSANTSFVP